MPKKMSFNQTFLFRGIALSLLMLLTIHPASGQPTNQAKPPKLIVGISLDGFPVDWIQKHWTLLGEGGLKKLFNQGMVFTEASLPYFLAGSASSNASLSTGAPPSIHGIISDGWYNRLKREEVHPTENFLLQSVGSDGTYGKHGPDHLIATTIGDMLSLSSGMRSKVVSIAPKPEASIMLSGHLTSGTYWFDNRSGNWITSSAYMQELPNWATYFNSRKSGDLYSSRDWNLLLAENQYLLCLPDANPFETGFFGRFATFPYRMNRLKRESFNRDYEVLFASPFGNTLTLDFALSAIAGEELGADLYPDLLLVGLSSLYEVSKNFGSDSRELLDCLLRLDMDLQHFLYVLEDKVGRNNLLFFLTSTHGQVRDPDYAKSLHLPSGYFRYRNAMALLNSYLSALYGEGAWIESYINNQVYINELQIEKAKISFADILDQAARFLTHFEGVAQAVPTSAINARISTGSWEPMIRTSYFPDRSGDILIILHPGWIPESGWDTDCLSPYPYDSRIPLVFYGWGLPALRINRKITILDVAPTIASILGIAIPEGATGQTLTEILK